MIGSTRSMVPRALCLGIAGGFRSLPPLGALALTHDKATIKRGWRSWPVFNSWLGRGLMISGGAAEFVTDKLPWTQSRLALSVQPSTLDTGLVGRTALVALAGAALGSEYGGERSVATGAAFAALGALLGNYGGYYARRAVVKSTDLPDPTVAAIEDVATVTLLSAVVRERWSESGDRAGAQGRPDGAVATCSRINGTAARGRTRDPCGPRRPHHSGKERP